MLVQKAAWMKSGASQAAVKGMGYGRGAASRYPAQALVMIVQRAGEPDYLGPSFRDRDQTHRLYSFSSRPETQELVSCGHLASCPIHTKICTETKHCLLKERLFLIMH